MTMERNDSTNLALTDVKLNPSEYQNLYQPLEVPKAQNTKYIALGFRLISLQ
jgi:hypothetical protein